MNFEDKYSREDVFSSPSSSDFIMARKLQKQFDKENNPDIYSVDTLLAKNLQDQFRQEEAIENPKGDLVYKKGSNKQGSCRSLVDPSWELIDPTPDIYILFAAFNTKFFWGKLDSVCVSWSKRMKRCAGVCSYQGLGGLCHITLSEPLLKLRPRKDLIETLLHEMIHALLFVTHNNRDRDGHGPEFHKHMYRINKEAGTNITVYHDFHDEVELYLQHWWRCDGPCQKWKPYFGIVRRSMNRAPGPNDRWWGEHSRTCGGTYTKIKSPEKKGKNKKEIHTEKSNNDIRKYLPSTSKEISPVSIVDPKSKKKIEVPDKLSSNVHTLEKTEKSPILTTNNISKNIHGFSNTKSWNKGGMRNNSNVIVITKKPTVISKDEKDNKTILSPSVKKSPDNTFKEQNYEVVRQHWVNKFPGSQTANPIKRKPESNSPFHQKVPKIDNETPKSSFDNVSCPVCSKFYPMDSLNEHLDNCLSVDNFESSKNCSICSEKIQKIDYEQHVKQCKKSSENNDSLNDSSVMIIEDDDLDSMDTVDCSKCGSKILIDDFDDHNKLCGKKSQCPECGKKIGQDIFDLHVSECLLKKLDEVNKRFNIQEKKNLDCSLVDCLACGKKVSRALLSQHLDECLNEVFTDKEKCPDSEVDVDEKLFNCPVCTRLYSEVEMNSHVDQCLMKVSDNSS